VSVNTPYSCIALTLGMILSGKTKTRFEEAQDKAATADRRAAAAGRASGRFRNR
jgi:hypothetical protein